MKERNIRVPAGDTTIETPLLTESGPTYIISVHVGELLGSFLRAGQPHWLQLAGQD